MALNTEVSPAGSLNLPAIGKGVVVTLVLAVLTCLLAGAIFYFSSASERFLPWVAAGILLFSVLTGSILTATQAGSKGLLHGMGVGLIAFILLWVIAMVALPGPLAIVGILQKFVILVAGGALGGMLGVALS